MIDKFFGTLPNIDRNATSVIERRSKFYIELLNSRRKKGRSEKRVERTREWKSSFEVVDRKSKKKTKRAMSDLNCPDSTYHEFNVVCSSESMKPVRCRCIEGCWTSASRGCRTSPQKKKFRRLRESRSTVARQRARLLTRARAIIIYYRVFLYAHRCTFIGRYSKKYIIVHNWRRGKFWK